MTVTMQTEYNENLVDLKIFEEGGFGGGEEFLLRLPD
jgi:hypothetical protein